MTERVTQPSEASKTNWADGGSAYSNADPGSGKRAVGFQPKDEPTPGPGEIIPAETHNFLWRLGMEMISWLRDYQIREWSDLAEGIAATSAGEMFRVAPSGTAMTARGAQIFNVSGTGTGSTNVSEICTDGEQIYYTNGGYMIAADPADGSEIWENNDTAVVTFPALCTDGFYVYAMGDTNDRGIHQCERATGDVVDSAGTDYDCNKIVTNGYYIVGIDANSFTGYVTFWSNIQSASIAQDGRYDTSSPGLQDVCIDQDQCYVTGNPVSSNSVWAMNLSTRALAWAAVLPTTSAPTLLTSICCDGNRVYVAGSRTALTAGGSANLFCLDRITGNTLWTMDLVDSGLNNRSASFGAATDGRYLFVYLATAEELAVVDLHGGPAQVGFIADARYPICDGVSVIGNSDVGTQLKRSRWIDAVRTFRRTAGTDTNRRVFYTLAVPADRLT
jgi:hypothetical protein